VTLNHPVNQRVPHLDELRSSGTMHVVNDKE